MRTTLQVLTFILFLQTSLFAQPCGCTLTQGSFSAPLPFMSTSSSAVNFYAYGNPTASSSNTGLEMSESLVVMLHEDTNTGNTSLIILLDQAPDGTGGDMDLTVNCLPSSAAVALSDDGGELSGTPPTITGDFFWSPCCTDGGVISGVGCGNTFTINPTINSGIDFFSLVYGTPASPTYINMPNIQCPITINCGGAPCCVEAFDVSAVPQNPSCGNSTDGSIDLTTDCATTPTFLWSNGAVTEDVSNLSVGTYTVTITDVNGCAQTESYTLTPNNSDPEPMITGPTEFCTGDVVILGVDGNYASYLWSNGTMASTLPTITPGAYSVTVTDVAGCTGIADLTLIENPEPVENDNGAYCLGGTFLYEGDGQNYTQGYYQVTFTGGSWQGCDSIVYLTVTENPDVYFDIEVAVCQGESYDVCDTPYDIPGGFTIDCGPSFYGCDSTISLTMYVLDPIADIAPPGLLGCGANNSIYLDGLTSQGDSFLWTSVNGDICDDPTSPFVQICLPGTYCLTATSTYTTLTQGVVTCTDETCVIVSSNNEVPLSTVTSLDILCNGETNGSATISVSNNGIGPFSYNWNPNVSSSETASDLAVGIYNVTITAASNGCSSVETIVINEPMAITSATSQQDVACNGEATGSAIAIPAGGTAPYSYLWCNNQTSQTVTGLTAGACSFTITDANSCTMVGSVTLFEPGPISLNTDQQNISCEGLMDGEAIVFPNGGTGPYMYLWCNNQTTQNATGLGSGTCSVVVTDANACTQSTSVELTEPPAMSINISQNNLSCNGSSDGTATASPSGGTMPYTYLWCNSQMTQTATGLSSGLCSVVVTDANGCTQTINADITAPTAMSISVSQNNVSCNGGNDGTATVLPIGGVEPYSYLWCNNQTASTATGLSLGDCTVTVTDSNNCTEVATVSLTEPSVISMSTSQIDISCNGGNDGSATVIPAGGTGPYTYQWCNGDDTATANDLGPGNCQIIVTDANACTQTAEVNIGQAIALEVSITSIDILCNGGTGSATATPSGGSGTYMYNWCDGQTTPTATSISAGICQVTITDSNGCTETASVSFTEPSPMNVSASATDISCAGADDGEASVNASGGQGPYTFEWCNGQNGADATNLAAGPCTVVVTDANGCTESASVNLGEPGPLGLTISSEDVSCFGADNGTATVSVDGGTGNYSYEWCDGQGTEMAIGLEAGLCSVVVTDGNGCTETISVIIDEPNETLSITGNSTDASCGNDNGSISISVSGGTSPYTYDWSNGDNSDNPLDLGPGSYTVTVTDGNDCTETFNIAVNTPSGLNVMALSTPVSCNGGADGTVAVTVNGGVAPYEYEWDPSSIPTDTSNPEDLIAGDYNVTVTDGSGCTFVASATVTEPDAITINGTSTDETCGESNGSISISVQGGTGAYSYAWSPQGGNVQNPDNLSIGSYSVIVTDDNACSETFTIDINTPNALGLSTTFVDVSCNGGSDGSIDLSVSGGVAPFSYDWDNTAAIEDPSGLAAGIYTVIVTDAADCTLSTQVTIAEPTAISITNISNQATCGNPNGSIALTVDGGTTPYTYAWDTGDDTANPGNLSPGTYIITVTDANGCESIEAIDVTEPPAILLNVSSTMTSCFSGADGTIELEVTGGTLPYTYLWNNTSIDEDPMGLPTGTYSVLVTDANGCTEETSISIGEPTGIEIQGSSTDALCGSANGTISVSVTGGTGPYTYNWTGTASTDANPTGLIPGAYTVTVTDLNTCTQTFSIDVETPTGLALSANSTDVNCFGGASGSIDLEVSGGSAPFTYLWDTGDTNEDLTDVPAGIYSVIVTDATGCTIILEETIVEPALLTVEGTSTDAICGQNNGAIDITASGGTGPYTYQWDPAGGSVEDPADLGIGNYTVIVTDANQCTETYEITVETPNGLSLSSAVLDASCNGGADGSVNLDVVGGTAPFIYNWMPGGFASQDIADLPAGTYSVTVTDADACTIVASATVSEPDAIIIDGTTTPETCDDVNGMVSINVIGGTGAYMYLWTPGNMTNQNPEDLANGDYDVVVTDINGCTGEASFTVSEPAALTGSTVPADVTCNGGADGTISAAIFGGEGPYTYSWSPIGGTDPIASDLPAGDYTLLLTDANGCTLVLTETVGEPTSINVSGTSQDATCGESNGSISITAMGGTAPYNYIWSPAASNSPDLTDLSAGNYSVDIVDANGCIFNYEITVNTPNMLALSTLGADALCNGGAEGSIDLTVTGGLGPFAYAWSNFANTQDLMNLSAGMYSVTVTDATGCTVITSEVIGQPPMIEISGTSTQAICGQDNGTINIIVTGGTAPYTYVWSNGSTDEDPENLGAGNYIVTVTDANQCTNTFSQNVDTPNGMTILTESVDASCLGDADGSINLTINGGEAPFTYSWDNAATTQDINDLAAGTYTVTVTDADDCTYVASAEVNEPEALVAIIQQPFDISCFGGSDGSIVLAVTGGTVPYTFAWSNGDNGQDPSGLSVGSYTVTVTDANACTSTDVVTLIEPTEIVLSTSSFVTSCNGSDDGSINLTINGGTGPYEFNWDNNTTNQNPTGLSAGTYQVVVTDSNGCSETTTALVDEPTPVVVSITAISDYAGYNLSCSNSLDGFATAMAEGGVSPFTYEWENGNLGNTITDLGAGSYTVTATDANGCIGETLLTLQAPEAILISSTNHDVSCFGYNDGHILIDNASGGSPPYIYSLDGSDFTPTGFFTDLPAGQYDLIVQDANGCEIEMTQVINQSSELQVNLSTLGGDESLQLGDSIEVAVQISTDTSNLQEWGWTSGTYWQDPNCDSCLVRWVYPMQTTLYEYIAVDENGCVGEDELLITVRKDRAVYIPNAFSPNGDGNNDIFFINAGQEVQQINDFKIYNRWGEVVFSLSNFYANDPGQGWDGRFKGEFLNPAVFVYHAEVLFVDGRVELLSGDVTINR